MKTTAVVRSAGVSLKLLLRTYHYSVDVNCIALQQLTQLEFKLVPFYKAFYFVFTQPGFICMISYPFVRWMINKKYFLPFFPESWCEAYTIWDTIYTMMMMMCGSLKSCNLQRCKVKPRWSNRNCRGGHWRLAVKAGQSPQTPMLKHRTLQL